MIINAGLEGVGKSDGGAFVPGILRSGKSEITLKNRKYSIKTGTVDDFDCSYFKTFHGTRHSSIVNPGQLRTRDRNDVFKDNASQDSYRLQESRDSLTETRNSGDELKDEVNEASEQADESLVKGRSMGELVRNASLRSRRSMHDAKKQQFARMRSATMAYDHVIVTLKDRLDARVTGQSYSTDIDSVLSPLHDKEADKQFEVATKAEYADDMKPSNGFSRQYLKEQSPVEDEECITIIDSKEDGIKYYLHKKPAKQPDKAYNKTDTTKNMLEEVKMKISRGPERRLKMYDYISYSKLPRRDAFSSRDDTFDNDVFVKNNDLGVWRKVEKCDETKEVKHRAAKELITRGRILSESDSEHLSHINVKAAQHAKEARQNFKSEQSKSKLKKQTNMTYQLEDELNLSECDDEEDKKSCFSSFENEISDQAHKPFSASKSVCTENVNQIVYKRRVSVLPYSELVKMDTVLVSEKEHYGRHYFCTIDHDTFHKADSSSDNDKFSWMAKNRFRQSVKSSISYRTGYATGSSSSLSITDDLEGGLMADLKGRRVFQTHQPVRMSSCDTTTTHIDKHGHVMEWLEEQHALWEPSHRHHRGHVLRGLKHAGSLPGKMRQASVHSSLSSKQHPMHNQSSFSTQSFPEPVMEISSDEGPMASKKSVDGFYDVNRILDYVADSNRYINPHLLGFRAPDDHPNEGYSYNVRNNTFYDTAGNRPLNPKVRQSVTKFSTFDAGRYRLSSKLNSKQFHSHSIDPEKMFNSELGNNAAGRLQRSSLSSQNNEEDHVSDILDALGVQVDATSLRQSDSFQDTFHKIVDATQNLNRRLNRLGVCEESVSGMEEEGGVEGEGCYQDVRCLRKAESSLAIEECKDLCAVQTTTYQYHFITKKPNIHHNDDVNPNLFQKSLKGDSLKHNEVTENMAAVKVLPTIHPINMKPYDKQIKRQVTPPRQVIRRPRVACEAWNVEVVEERGGQVVMGQQQAEVEMRRVEVATLVLRRPRSKPCRVPDKFGLFLAGVRVNLVNILERDRRCENCKIEVMRHKSRIYKDFMGCLQCQFHLHQLPSCENVKSVVVRKGMTSTYPS